MADEQALLKILVQLGVIGASDVRAAKELLKETGESGKDSLKGMNESMPANLAAWKNFSKGLQETEGDAGKLRESLHGLTGAARLGGLSEFAHLAHAALNPVAITVGALAIGLEQYFKWQERCEERHKEMIKDLQFINDEMRRMIAAGPSVQQDWVEITKTIAAARVEMNSLGEQLKEFEARSKVYNLAATDALQARIDGRERELTLAEEQLHVLVELGRITKEQADMRAGEIDHQKKLDAIAAEVAQKQAAAKNAETERDEELRRAGGAAAFTPEAQGAAQKKAHDAEEQLRRAKDLIENGPARLTELDKKIEELRRHKKEHGTDMDPSTGQLWWNQDEHAIEELERQKKQQQTNINNASSSLAGLSEEAARAKSDLATLQGLRDKFADLQHNIDLLNQAAIDANAAAGKKNVDEDARFAMSQFTRYRTDYNQPPSTGTDRQSHDEAVRRLNEGQAVGRELAKAAAEAAAAHNTALPAITAALVEMRRQNAELMRILAQRPTN